MLRVYILEDDVVQQSRLEDVVLSYSKANHYDARQFTCEVYGSSEKLLANLNDIDDNTLFFLDLELKGEETKGIDVAKLVHEKAPMALLVFVTTHSEFMPLTYQSLVGAIDFIEKGLSHKAYTQRVINCLDKLVKRQSQDFGSQTFLLHNDRVHIRVLYQDILYFETSFASHRLVLHTKTKIMEFYGTLDEVLKSDTENYLLKCHRSFVVNPQNITQFNEKERLVSFETGDTCAVARGKVKDVKKRWGRD